MAIGGILLWLVAKAGARESCCTIGEAVKAGARESCCTIGEAVRHKLETVICHTFVFRNEEYGREFGRANRP
jgi:hypothetical protein